MKKNNKLFISEELKNKLMEGIKKTLEENTYWEAKLIFEDKEITYFETLEEAAHYYLWSDYRINEQGRNELIKFLNIEQYLEHKAQQEEQDGHALVFRGEYE